MECAKGPISGVCRLCLTRYIVPEMIILNKNQQYVVEIKQITGINVNPITDCCIYMCSSCQTVLQQCIDFRTTCVHNDTIFHQLYSNEFTECAETELKPEQLYIPVVKVETELEYAEAKTEPLSTDSAEDIGFEDVLAECNSNSEPETRSTLSFEAPLKVPKKRGRKPKGTPQKELPETEVKIHKKRGRKPLPGPKCKKDESKRQCDICGVMVRHSWFTKHREIHDPNRKLFECTYCNKAFPHEKQLKHHVNAVHTRAQKYECQQCDKSYWRPNTLHQHIIATHSGEKRYACKICDVKFSHPCHRLHHYKTRHSEARPHACEYCDRTFKVKGDLTLHVRTHTGEKPFKCDICGKTFAKSYNVVIHKKSHQNEQERLERKNQQVEGAAAAPLPLNPFTNYMNM
ncbi:zinc finger protein 32-like isoform X2 [Uranotaenia lowii]|nr:zinc finger protein 32-like isoform X2 [Uranotaenia lowii]XP_055600303.1 zinc finger protein 32-like isoform X2 [Uranotaenia lowii]